MRNKAPKIKAGDLVISNDVNEYEIESGYERLYSDPFRMDYEVDQYVLWRHPTPALVLEVKPTGWSKAKVLAGDKMGWIWCDYLEVVG